MKTFRCVTPWLLALAFVALLGACGNKGDLVRPVASTEAPTAN